MYRLPRCFGKPAALLIVTILIHGEAFSRLIGEDGCIEKRWLCDEVSHESH